MYAQEHWLDGGWALRPNLVAGGLTLFVGFAVVTYFAATYRQTVINGDYITVYSLKPIVWIACAVVSAIGFATLIAGIVAEDRPSKTTYPSVGIYNPNMVGVPQFCSNCGASRDGVFCKYRGKKTRLTKWMHKVHRQNGPGGLRNMSELRLMISEPPIICL